MGFCPYCKQIVGENVTECPSCGMSWAGQTEAQPQYRQPPPQQPPPQQYQQPQPQQYQQPPPQQYQQPPPQQYQQPPPQQYQQPPPQPKYQQPPPQHYQQPPPQQYQQPYPPNQPRPRVLVGGGSMIGAMFGGIGALVASFMFYMQIGMNGVEYIQLWDYIEYLPDEFAYLWMLPVGGLLALIFAIICYAAQSRGLGYLVGIIGLLLMLLPLLFAAHAVAEYEVEFADIFYSSVDAAVDERQFTLFLGGIMSIFSGLMVMIGGFGLAGKIGRQRRRGPETYYR